MYSNYRLIHKFFSITCTQVFLAYFNVLLLLYANLSSRCCSGVWRSSRYCSGVWRSSRCCLGVWRSIQIGEGLKVNLIGEGELKRIYWRPSHIQTLQDYHLFATHFLVPKPHKLWGVVIFTFHFSFKTFKFFSRRVFL